MNRRRYLSMAATAGVLGTAGCIGSLGGNSGKEQTYLNEPEGRQFDSSDYPYPAWGQDLPEVTLHAPIADRDITTTEFDGKNVVITFIYTNCNTVCPVLTSSLKRVQDHAAENGYSDDVVFLEVTFDPKRDDAERLKQYADTMNVDLDADNWYFLRPESHDRAKEVAQETYGVTFEKTKQTGENDYMFNHLGLVVLANQHAIVERAYSGNGPKSKPLLADLETIRNKQG